MNKKIQKIFITTLLFSFLSVVFAPSARADFWGSEMAGQIWKQTEEQMVKSIQDTILANLKMAALRILQARLMSLLGSSGSTVPGVAGYIISDWKVFIYTSASQYSNQVTNDFFRNLQAGSTSAMNQYVIGPAQSAVNVDYWNMRPDLQYYCPGGDPSKAFSSGTSNPWKCFQMSGAPQNDLAFTFLRAEGYKQAAYNQQAQAKMSEGQSGAGYVGKERKITIPGPKDTEATTASGAKVSVPAISTYQGQNIETTGSDIKETFNEVMIRMKTQMLSMARSVPEVATAMVSQMISQIIQQGVTKIINPSSSGSSSFNVSSMTNQMTNQAQVLIQNGVRQVANPNMFFGR